MMMGNHWTSCTFTMQQIGRWVVAHSKADSNLHGHCLTISRKQCPLWILFMSQYLNPPSALSDHRKSVAWLISDGPHSAAYWYKLGPDRVNAEYLCPRKAATIFQHTHALALGHGHGHRVAEEERDVTRGDVYLSKVCSHPGSQCEWGMTNMLAMALGGPVYARHWPTRASRTVATMPLCQALRMTQVCIET